jgi:hypothetical protein
MLLLWRQRPFGRIIGLTWGLYGASVAILEGVGESATLLKPLRDRIPAISLAWWLVGAAVVLLAWGFEAAFRTARESAGEIARLVDDANAPRLAALTRMESQLVDDRLSLIDELQDHSTKLVSSGGSSVEDAMSGRAAALAARFTGDVEFGQLWNAYQRSCLDFVLAASIKNALTTTADIQQHKRTAGLRILEARDALTSKLMKL